MIYIGGGIGQAEAKARERAGMIKAQFVNAELTPRLVCSCGQVLDLTLEESYTIQ